MKKRLILLTLSTLIVTVACNNKDRPDKTFSTIDFGDFQMKTPKNWRKVELQEIDSYVGGITNKVDTLVFDFGRYSSDLSEDSERQLYSDLIINGKKAYVTKPKLKGKGCFGGAH